MAFSRRIFITFFCCFVIAKSENTNKDVTENQDSSPQITAVLDFLNSNSNRVYEYKRGYLVGAQNKADIIEVTIEVNVDCLRTYPEIPCNDDVLTCNAFIRQNPDQTYQVLSDVKCSPKIKISVEDVEEVQRSVPMVFGEQSQGDMEKIDLSSEALSPAQGSADFVAVRREHISCPGCPYDVNIHAPGVGELVNTAVKHIESERNQRHKIVNVRRLQQQVVAGVKYILLADVAQTMCPKDADLSAPCILDTSVEPFICEITFIEKPWISDSKHIIKNNCTVSQEYEPVDVTRRDQDDMNNEILPHGGFINPAPQDDPKPVPNYDAIAQTGNMEIEMDADQLAELESQILFSDMIEVPKVSKVDQSQNTRVASPMVEMKYVSVDEPMQLITDTEDHLKVEPLNVEEDGLLYRIPLFNDVPVIEETEPVVTMYNYQNEEPIKTSEENIVIKDTRNYEPAQFESSLPVQERVTRHNDDSDSDSDSTSEESKEKEVMAEIKNSTERSRQDVEVRKAEVTDNTSEESSESLNTEEKRQRVRRGQDSKNRPKRVADNNNDDKNDSSSSSSSSSDDDDDNNDNNNTDNHTTRKAKSQKLKKTNDNDNDSSSSSSSSSDEDNNNDRHKRSVGQMEKISPDEKVIVRDLADFAAATLDNIDDDHHKRVILQILGAKKLKLDGIYYQIILRLGISHCHEHEHNENCREKLFTNLTKICKVQVHVDDDYSNPKVVKSQCQNIKKDENDRNRTNYSRYRRSVVIGGITDASTDNPNVQKFVKDTLNHLDSVSDHPNKHKTVEIVSATKQMVAGFRYVITALIGLSDCSKSEKKLPETCGLLSDNQPETCTIDVWDRQWLNKTIYRINCNESVYQFGDEKESRRRRKRSGMPGGISEIPKDSAEVLDHLTRSLVYLDSKSDHENRYLVDEVLSASTQVVAGSMLRIQARIAVSDCKKGSELKNCTKLNDTLSKPTVCNFKIWEKKWLNFTQTNITCDNHQSHSFRRKRSAQIKGGITGIPKDSANVINHLTRSLVYLDSKSDHENRYLVDEVLSASTQVVAGSLLRIQARIAVSDCKKGSELKNCTKLNDTLSKPTVCDFEIWEQPWLNFTQTNITCDNHQSHSFRRKRSIDLWDDFDDEKESRRRRKRSGIPGGITEIPKDSANVINHLTRSLVYLDSKSDHENRYLVDEVLSASTQVVAGSLLRIQARIAVSDCKKGSELKNCTKLNDTLSKPTVCDFEIWEKKWLNFTQTNITCDNQQSHSLRRKRSAGIKGGITEIPKDSANVINHLTRSLVYLDSKSDHENRYLVDEVLSASTQVVAGSLLRIQARIAVSDCKKGSELKNCTKLNDTLSKPTVCDFEIWEQPWLNFTQTNITCDNHQSHSFRRKRSIDLWDDFDDEKESRRRRKRSGIPGGITEIPKDSANVINHLTRSLVYLDSKSDHENRYLVDEVLSASTQVVAGSLLRIQARIAVSDCKKGSELKNCTKLNDTLSKPTVCNFKIWEKKWLNFTQTNITCDNQQSHSFRRKRSAGIKGGITEIPKDSANVINHLTRSLVYLDSKSDHENRYLVDEVLSASTQVVAGSLLRIQARIAVSDCKKGSELKNCIKLNDTLSKPTVCDFEIWEKKWLNFTQTNITCDNQQSHSFRRKRSAGIKGGITEIPKDSANVLNHLTRSLVYLDSKSDHENRYLVDEVLSASTQVVAGSKLRIQARIAVSDCKKGSELKNCTKLNDTLSKPTVCDFEIWEKAWLNFTQTNITCDNHQSHSFRRKRSIDLWDDFDDEKESRRRRKRSGIPGGITEIPKDSANVLNHLTRSLVYLDSKSDHENRYLVDEVLSASTQVVAGRLLRIQARIAVSDCKKESELKNCTKLNDTLSKPTVCNFKIWEKKWLNFTQTNITCDNQQSHSFVWDDFDDKKESRRRRKRSDQIVGGITEIPKDSAYVLNHLTRSLVYLDSKSDHENTYLVDEVLSASRQVVAGWLLRIQARIAVSDCKKGSELKNCTKLNDTLSKPTVCDFEIWEKPWLNFTQTNITCDNHQSHSFRRKRSIIPDKPGLLGADEELSTEHIEAKNFIKMALEYISSKSETAGQYELKKIKKVNRRIVAGALWNIEADIALCRQVELLRTTHSMCPDFTENINCHFIVLNRPWEANGLTINVTCDNDDQVYSYMPINGFSEDKLSAFDYERNFKGFIKKYKKVYGVEEYNYRLKVFRDNVNKIALLNKYEKGTAQYAITVFADMTEKEFSRSHGYRPELQNENELPLVQAKIPDIKLPTEFDWRTKGAVTQVKNQGICGSCWAFSVTGNVEGQYAINYGKLLEFSEQELVDCDKVDQGCNGGLMDNAYRVIEKLGGLEAESDYPYEGDDETCHFNPSKVKVQLTGALNISHNETDMAKWLVQNGPISIAINANAMQFYAGGVSHPWKILCNPKNLDHGVLIVGYGVHKYTLFNKTLPYWIVKNSWSPSWGEQGYYRVYRGDGTCGLNQTPSSAIVA